MSQATEVPDEIVTDVIESIEDEECLGNMQATSYRPVQPLTTAAAHTSAAPAYEARMTASDAFSLMREKEVISEAVEPAATKREAVDTVSDWQSGRDATPASSLSSVFDSLFEADDEQAEPVISNEPVGARPSIGFDEPASFIEDEEEAEDDIAMPAPGISAVRERVETMSAPSFAPASFTAPTPARYEAPQRAVPVVKAEPVRDEKPQAPVVVRKEYVKPPLRR